LHQQRIAPKCISVLPRSKYGPCSPASYSGLGNLRREAEPFLRVTRPCIALQQRENKPACTIPTRDPSPRGPLLLEPAISQQAKLCGLGLIHPVWYPSQALRIPATEKHPRGRITHSSTSVDYQKAYINWASKSRWVSTMTSNMKFLRPLLSWMPLQTLEGKILKWKFLLFTRLDLNPLYDSL